MSQQYRLSFYFGCNIGKVRENETIRPNCIPALGTLRKLESSARFLAIER